MIKLFEITIYMYIYIYNIYTYAFEWMKFHGKPFISSRYFRDKMAYFIRVYVVHGVHGERLNPHE